MENRNMDKNDPDKEDKLHFVNKEEQVEENSSSTRLVKDLEPQHLLILGNQHFTDTFSQKFFLHRSLGLQNKLPKHIISFDERYFLCCLELIHTHSLGAATHNSSSKMQSLLESLGSREVSKEDICATRNLAIEYPPAAGIESCVADSTEDWILGAITGSKSMLNILNSPLLNQVDSVKENTDSEETVFSDFMSSPGGFSVSSSQKLQVEMTVPECHVYGYKPAHSRFLSMSSTNSTCSDQSSLTASAPISQGMLQRRWKNGLPHYVFSVDGKKDVYVADLQKIDSPDDKFLDYSYTFHWRPDGRKERDVCVKESHLVGKMTASTSLTLSSTKLDIMETRFVLFGSMDDCMDDTQTNHVLTKNKRLSKKVIDVFRTSQSYKQRSLSKFGGTGAILEDASSVPSLDMYDANYSCGNTLVDHQIPPNFELAAIVVRDHIYDSSKEAKTGGWGLKFLKEPRAAPKSSSLETSVECCSRSTSECSTSVDVIVPAGFHGGPRSRHGGPSSLLDRWSSGGRCDCGGWDVGCPLTVLNSALSTTKASSQTDTSIDCKTFDLYIQGSHSAPTMKMANIHDGLYYIHFHSTLSALQSFAIAAAVIHRHSPILQPTLYRR